MLGTLIRVLKPISIKSSENKEYWNFIPTPQPKVAFFTLITINETKSDFTKIILTLHFGG